MARCSAWNSDAGHIIVVIAWAAGSAAMDGGDHMRTVLLVALCCLACAASCVGTNSEPVAQPRWDCAAAAQLASSWEVIEPAIDDADEARRLANAVLCMPESDVFRAYVDAHLDEPLIISSWGDTEEEHEVLSGEEAIERVPNFVGVEQQTYSASLNRGNIELKAQGEICHYTVLLGRRNSEW